MNANGKRSLLDVAIEREDWELAALCLIAGVIKAAEGLPQETLEALLDELEIEGEQPMRRSGRGTGRRRPGRHEQF
jgi:hypothetical protein